MNRRSFFSTLVKGVGVFSILPPAETYARIWKATREQRIFTCGIKEQLEKCVALNSPRMDLKALFAELNAIQVKHRQMHPGKIEIWCDPQALPLLPCFWS